MHEFDMYHKDVFFLQMRDYWKDLFQVLSEHKCDFLDFLPKFFNSQFMHNCDIRNPYYTAAPWIEILSRLEKEGITIQTVDEPILGLFLSRWTADFYASATHYCQLEGNVVYNEKPIKSLLSVFPGIHDMPMPLLVRKIYCKELGHPEPTYVYTPGIENEVLFEDYWK